MILNINIVLIFMEYNNFINNSSMIVNLNIIYLYIVLIFMEYNNFINNSSMFINIMCCKIPLIYNTFKIHRTF